MIKTITSIHNPLVKHLVTLSEKPKVRRESGTFIVEGVREVQLALKGGFTPKMFLFNSSIINYNQLLEKIGHILFDTETIEVHHQVYNKIAYRESTEGVIAVFYSRSLDMDDLALQDKPLILVAEAPEKPGNIGALLRTADAAGTDAFIIANPNTDIYNPNIIRASIGCVFTNHVVQGSTSEIIQFLKSHHIPIACATLTDEAVNCYDIDFTGPIAIVVGTESTGLSDEWILAADYNMIIPMRGQIDSMNVSVSAAILLFEAVRQRMTT
ncbi:MAG: RNA methyltransferase [Saprospiraceae bacterium]|nr:MAG: rRNA methylase [Bacteroidetes bacterium OLB9]MCO6462953.1 RNA methyltransferase [Saprospiraceae bacterium]MCZ2338262.1 RNA methyltransferase [Chitinophagales bacterium]